MTGRIDETIDRTRDRGFTFIRGEDEKRYFAHVTGMAVPSSFDDLNPGEEVDFDVRDDPKGPRAINIQRRAAVSAEA